MIYVSFFFISFQLASYIRRRGRRKEEDSKSDNSNKILQHNNDEEDLSTSHSINSSIDNKNMDSLEKKEDSISEEINEEISISEEIESDTNLLGLLPDEFPKTDLTTKKRELFDIAGPSTSKFQIDDLQLSGDFIAQHFQQPVHNEMDSLDAVLNEIDSISVDDKNSKPEVVEKREVSPPVDVILINDQKISINALKVQQTSHESSFNQSTTNDISDIVRDDPSLKNSQSELEETNPDKNNELRKTRSLENTIIHPNVTDRSFRSLDATVDFYKILETSDLLVNKNDKSENNDSIEEDKSIEEVMISNHSIEISLNASNLSSLDPNINLLDESAMNKILDATQNSDSDEILNLKEKILVADEISKTKILEESAIKSDDEIDGGGETSAKQMEKVEFSREALEDISEESERDFESLEKRRLYQIGSSVDNSVIEKGQEIRKMLEENLNQNSSVPSLVCSSFDSVVSLNMFQSMETKVKDLQDIISGKDVCLTALNMQLEGFSRRGSLKDGKDSWRELPPSGRDSSSLATTSTEYRTIQDDYVAKLFDFQGEITERDQLIDKLTESLQQSMLVREQLQSQGERLTSEVVQLRKQLNETMDLIKKPHWMRENESSGQRISEISIDLVSETDEESEKNLTDADVRSTRNSRERQFNEFYDQQIDPTFSKQIEQFQKYLSQEEMRIFFMVQKKFDDFLVQEIEKSRIKNESELKIITDRLESEKSERDNEVIRLRQLLSSVKNGSTEVMELKQELETKHAQEMEDLRTYFERKCSDLEKQYSEEVFSQQSRRHSNDTGSELSDQENNQTEEGFNSQQTSPKRKKDELYASPTHRKITPTNIGPPNLSPGRKRRISLNVGAGGDVIDEGVSDFSFC